MTPPDHISSSSSSSSNTIVVLDVSKLPRNYPRRFVPEQFEFRWENLELLFSNLRQRDVLTKQDLISWLRDYYELTSLINEERTIREVRTTQDTTNKEFEEQFLEFVQEYDPKIKKGFFELDRKYVSLPTRRELVTSRQSNYFPLDRGKENTVKIFREENLALETKDDELSQGYQKIVGAILIPFKGEDRTYYQMSKFLEEPDRSLRREAYLATNERVARDSRAFDDLYDEFVKVRHRIGTNAGFGNYRDYIFQKKERFDYSVEDNLRLVSAIEKYFVPLSRKIDRRRMEEMQLDIIRPFDMQVDPKNRPPLRPFNEISELISGCSKIFSRIDPKLESYFSMMVENNLLDLASRKGKASGGYMTEFMEEKYPFIFMNAVGTDGDSRVLMHECGHSFHYFLKRDKDFVHSETDIPMEFAEVASTTMELIGGEHIESAFYDKDGARRSNRHELETITKLFPWVGIIDSFQHWVYTHPEASTEDRASEWVRVFAKFKGLESYEGGGLENYVQNRWHMQLHVFQGPFYYIEYAIATLGALGIWTRYREDPREAITLYENALSLGGTKPLPELFEAAGLPWDLGEGTVSKYARELEKVLDELI
jgi:oligoendopeptidase F